MAPEPITFQRLPDPSAIAEMKAAYLASLSAPMDGMWGAGFIDPSPHWQIRVDGTAAGYFATNGEDTLWQFHVSPRHLAIVSELFSRVLAETEATKAVVATIDSLFLSLCLDVHSSVTVHTYLYELGASVPAEPGRPAKLSIARPEELERIVQFQRACLSGGAELEGWLTGYSANLIERGELFVLQAGGEWIGLGERRRSDSQRGVADVGMMVHPSQRGHGWAGHILQLLCEKCSLEGLQAICSTTVENVAAQRAIERAGFRSRHRILDVQF